MIDLHGNIVSTRPRCLMKLMKRKLVAESQTCEWKGMTRSLLLIRVAIRYRILLRDEKTGRDPVTDTSHLLTGYTRHASYILCMYVCTCYNKSQNYLQLLVSYNRYFFLHIVYGKLLYRIYRR